MKHNYLNLIRRLTALLIISGALNVGLCAFLIYWIIKERPPTPYCEHLPAQLSLESRAITPSRPLMNVIDCYRTLSLEQLISELSNSESIENEFTYRDLALAFLVTFHHFDVQRAIQLKEMPLRQKVSISKSNLDMPLELHVYLHLSKNDYEAILQFARTEEWPLTPFGIFQKLQKDNATPSLEEAFYHTPHFMAVEVLFRRVDKPLKRKELLQIILEGSWEMLSSFYSEQRILLDLSRARRQKFLLLYIDNSSKSAAYMMLKAEGKQALMALDDHQIIKTLSLMDERTPALIDLAMSLCKSSKNEEVIQSSNACLNKFGLKQASIQSIQPPIKPLTHSYVVKEGDSLWKIAKGQCVSIKKLTEFNHLDEGSILQPGMKLIIPSN
jgi:hypothetical protein